MRIAALSDTHGKHRQVDVPDADVLIFAGDLMTGGWGRSEVLDFGNWFSDLPHKTKVLVAGNHDRLFETNPTWCIQCFSGNVIYLHDCYTVIDGKKFYGSPVQPWFHDWAFNVPRGPAIKEYWDRIPDDTDVLITHGPPLGLLDKVVSSLHYLYDEYEHLGCEELRYAVERIRPDHHIFGHIHGGYGYARLKYESPDNQYTALHNVAICNEAYNAVNPVTVLDI